MSLFLVWNEDETVKTTVVLGEEISIQRLLEQGK